MVTVSVCETAAVAEQVLCYRLSLCLGGSTGLSGFDVLQVAQGSLTCRLLLFGLVGFMVQLGWLQTNAVQCSHDWMIMGDCVCWSCTCVLCFKLLGLFYACMHCHAHGQ